MFQSLKRSASAPASAPAPAPAPDVVPIGSANRNHLVPSIQDVVRHYHQFIGGAPTRRQLAWGFGEDMERRGEAAETSLIVTLGYPGESLWSPRYWMPSEGFCALGVGIGLAFLVYLYYLSTVSEWSALSRYHLGREHARRRMLFAPHVCQHGHMHTD